MAKIETLSCDNCGKLKGETNHWWTILANIKTKSLYIFPLESKSDISRWNDYIELYACGLECCAILESKVKEGKNPLVKT